MNFFQALKNKLSRAEGAGDQELSPIEAFWKNPQVHKVPLLALSEQPSALILKDWLDTLPVAGKLVADLGCGQGGFFPFFEGAKKVYAVDWSPPLLDIARQKNPENTLFIQKDIRDMRLPESVGLAVSIDALFPYDPADAIVLLAKIFQCVQAGGHVLLVVPSWESEMIVQSAVQYMGGISERQRDLAHKLVLERFASPYGWMGINSSLISKFWMLEEIKSFLLHYFDCVIEKEAKITYAWQQVADAFQPGKAARLPDPWLWGFWIRVNKPPSLE